jgi:predicted dehydrogenase
LNPINNRPFKVLMMGFGRMGQQHARLLSRLNDSVRLVGIVDPHADLSVMDQSVEGVPFYLNCSDWRDSGNSADLMLIASPNGWHPVHLGYAMDMGMSALVEKPLCIRSSQALDLVNRAESQGFASWVMMQARLNPTLVHLKELVDGGELGEIFQVDIQCYWNRDASYYRPGGWQGDPKLDGGTLYTQFSHVLDAVHWILGPWTGIQAEIHNRTHQDLHRLDDAGRITFDVGGTALGTMVYSTSAYGGNLDQSITVLGSQGAVRISGQYMNQFYWYKVRGRDKAPVLPTTGPDDHRLALWRQVIKALGSKNQVQATTTDLVGLSEAAKIVQLIEQIYQEAKRGPGTMEHLDRSMDESLPVLPTKVYASAGI